MATSIEVFLKKQTTQYQHHLSIRNKAQRVLQHQQNIRTFQTIPKHHLPARPLETPTTNTTLHANFLQKYHTIFFKHLDEVIMHNSITLELEETRLKHILLHTEKELSTLTAPSSIIAQYYHLFTSENDVIQHDIHPDLLKHITSAELTSPLSQAPHAKEPPMPHPLLKPASKNRFSRKRCNKLQHQKNKAKRPKQAPPCTNTSPISPSSPSTSLPLTSTSQHFLARSPTNTSPT